MNMPYSQIIKMNPGVVDRVNLCLFTCVAAVNIAVWLCQAPCTDQHTWHAAVAEPCRGAPSLARQIAGHCGAEAAFLSASGRSGNLQVNNVNRGEERYERSLR